MKIDKLGPIIRPLFKNIKALFKDLIEGDVVLSFRKGPEGKVEDLKPILWDKAFGCQVKVDNVTDNGLFVVMEKNGGIFLSGKLLVLPQGNIDELIKSGKPNESILDAQKEIFNMLVGKLNDILMEKVEKDIHLVLGENFILNANNISFLPSAQEYTSYTANVKVAGPMSFSMALIISKELSDFILKHIDDEESEEEELKKEEKESQKPEEGKGEGEKHGEDDGKERNETIIKSIPIPKGDKNDSDFFIEYIMEEDFPVAQIGTSLWNALLKMKTYGMDYIILVDGLKFIGLLTMADIRRGLSPFIEDPFKDYCREQDLATKSFNVEWFLEKEIMPVPYNASLEKVLEIYLNQNVPYLPVCKGSRITGVITHKKLVNFLVGLLFKDMHDMHPDEELKSKLVADDSVETPSDHSAAQM